jgi:hypothetical protein
MKISLDTLPLGDRVVIGEMVKKCHAELVSASHRIKYLRDPEPSSG